MTAQTLPDEPNFCFVPAYDVGTDVQQIRIVIEGLAGHVPPPSSRSTSTTPSQSATSSTAGSDTAGRLDRLGGRLDARGGRRSEERCLALSDGLHPDQSSTLSIRREVGA